MSEVDNDIQRTKKNLEAAMQAFIVAQYGPDHWLGDYVISACVIDMTVNTSGPQRNLYLHDGRGPFHSMRGLVEESADWLIEMKEEERSDERDDD